MSIYQPIIGIPCRNDTSGLYPGQLVNAQSSTYIKAVLQAGGIPVLIPLNLIQPQLDILLNRLDGLIFAGGGDIEPVRYHQSAQVDNIGGVQIDRDDLEIRLMQMSMQTGKPFLGICRGFQVMNVANGGTLWQDIISQKPGAMRHDYFYDPKMHYPRDFIAHYVYLDGPSIMHDLLDEDCFPVNSLHHQGVKQIAPNLRSLGYADDGIIEILQAPDHPFGLGVQWHPEELVDEHESARKLFTALVKAAGENRHNGHQR